MKSPNKHPVGLPHIPHALKNAQAGLRAAWQHEDAFRQEIFVAAIAIPVALFSPADKTGKILMISSILLVLIIELVNSAVEAAVDHTSLDQHPFAKRAKDIAGAAVLMCIVNAVVIWFTVLFV
jgi:diacylglycerol kinase (ATP)